MIEKAVPPLFRQIDSSMVWVRLQYFGNIHFAWLTGKPIYHIYITLCCSIAAVLHDLLKFICVKCPCIDGCKLSVLLTMKVCEQIANYFNLSFWLQRSGEAKRAGTSRWAKRAFETWVSSPQTQATYRSAIHAQQALLKHCCCYCCWCRNNGLLIGFCFELCCGP